MPCSSAELLQTEATEPDQVFRIGYIHFLTTTSFISTFVFQGDHQCSGVTLNSLNSAVAARSTALTRM